jgi:hypothetical protein
MEQYNLVKKQLNDKLLFKLSQIGYALRCDLMFTNRIPNIDQNINLVNNLKNGDKIFISLIQEELTVNLKLLVQMLMKMQIKVYFYLMYEPVIHRDILLFLIPVSLGLFINNNIYDHPMIHSMPIGIRDCGSITPMHKGFTHSSLYDEGLKTVEKEYLCLMCFSDTHEERRRCYDALKNMNYIENLNNKEYEKQPAECCGNVPVWINYQYTHKSYFVLSPKGAGEDCHRFYEAIYLNAIPIVKRTNTSFDKLYNVFPCLIINDWNEITEELLLKNKAECFKKLEEFKIKYPNAFTDIHSIDELLLKT